ncbi:MAG: flagellar biosynthetic protein FliO [bacterium]|nr:flagellar biosynthetic protein FliO [bacterium]
MKYFIVVGIILIIGSNLNPLYAEKEDSYFEKSFKLERNENTLELNKIKNEKIDEKKEKIKYEYSLGKYIFKTIFALGIIGLAIFLVIRLFVKTPKNIMGRDQRGVINLLGSTALAPNKYLQLIEVAQKVLLLGVTENNISILTEIKDKEQIDLIKTYQSKALGKEGFPFGFYLNKMLKKLKGEENQVSFKDRVDFIEKQKNRLKNMKI